MYIELSWYTCFQIAISFAAVYSVLGFLSAVVPFIVSKLD
jgi:hypothetical protein